MMPQCFDQVKLRSRNELRLVDKGETLKVHALHCTIIVRINGLFAGKFFVKKFRIFSPLNENVSDMCASKNKWMDQQQQYD
jgi:hypothetical protein